MVSGGTGPWGWWLESGWWGVMPGMWCWWRGSMDREADSLIRRTAKLQSVLGG